MRNSVYSFGISKVNGIELFVRFCTEFLSVLNVLFEKVLARNVFVPDKVVSSLENKKPLQVRFDFRPWPEHVPSIPQIKPVRQLGPSRFSRKRFRDDVESISSVFYHSIVQRWCPIDIDRFTRIFLQRIKNDLTLVFAFQFFELVSQLDLRLCRQNQLLVFSVYFVLHIIDFTADQCEVVWNRANFEVARHGCLRQRVKLKLHFVLHKDSMCPFHQVNERRVYCTRFSHRILKIELLRVHLVPWKDVVKSRIKMRIVYELVFQRLLRRHNALFMQEFILLNWCKFRWLSCWLIFRS